MKNSKGIKILGNRCYIEIIVIIMKRVRNENGFHNVDYKKTIIPFSLTAGPGIGRYESRCVVRSRK